MIRGAVRPARKAPYAACLAAVLGALLVATPPPQGARAQADGRFEPRPDLRPAAVLPEGAVSTGIYRVLDEVRVNGNWLEFRIESEFGNYKPSSLALLSTRIAEIGILADALNRYRRSDPALAARLRDRFVRAGVFFVPSLADPASGEGWYKSLEPGEPGLAERKRRIADRLGLDVYSSNLLVQDLLDTLAATRAARQPAAAVAVPVPAGDGGPPPAEAVEGTIRAALARLGIARLADRNRERLEGLGIEADLIEVFLGHNMLSPRHQTVITEHLALLDGVQNRNSLLVTALGAATEREGAAYAQVARMLTLFHRHISPLTKLIPAGHIVLATTGAKGIVVVLPFDVVYWDPEAQRVFNGFAKYAADRDFRHWTLLTDGILTETAQARLLELKFDLIPRFLQRLSVKAPAKAAAASGAAGPDAPADAAAESDGTGRDSPAGAPPPAAGDPAGWVRAQPPENFTVQVMATRNLGALEAFLNKTRFPDAVGWFRFQRDGDTWFALLHGSYASREAAQSSVTHLPAPVQDAGVWIRRFSDVRAVMDAK
jgi:hypothetical protein